MEKSLEISPVPPFSLKYTVWALKRSVANEVDSFKREVFSRIELIDGKAVLLEVTQKGSNEEPKLFVRALSKEPVEELEVKVEKRVQKLLGVYVELSRFYDLVKSDEQVFPLVRKFMGLKPPRFSTLFEALVNAVACQQVSLEVGLTLLSRLSRRFGKSFDGSSSHSFADPSRIVSAPISSIRELGFSFRKSVVIRELASFYLKGELDDESFEKMGNEQAFKALDAIPGIGRWSAEYALLRGLGRLEVFPADDVGAAKNLGSWLGIERKLSYEEVNKLTSKWGSYRGMIYFHLLLKKLSEEGVV